MISYQDVHRGEVYRGLLEELGWRKPRKDSATFSKGYARFFVEMTITYASYAHTPDDYTVMPAIKVGNEQLGQWTKQHLGESSRYVVPIWSPNQIWKELLLGLNDGPGKFFPILTSPTHINVAGLTELSSRIDRFAQELDLPEFVDSHLEDYLDTRGGRMLATSMLQFRLDGRHQLARDVADRAVSLNRARGFGEIDEYADWLHEVVSYPDSLFET